MARKHKKFFVKKTSVTRTVRIPAVVSAEREVVPSEPNAPGAIAIKQDDGSVQWFIVRHKVITPAVETVKANGPTTTKGQRNHTHKGGRNSK
jgi:hypothetical protein